MCSSAGRSRLVRKRSKQSGILVVLGCLHVTGLRVELGAGSKGMLRRVGHVGVA